MNNHPALDTDVIAHYEHQVSEQDRLSQDAMSRLEWLRTREILTRYLPPPPAKVLDIGGGAGAYALPLARQGYQVHLIDPVSRHVEQARTASQAQPDHPLADAVVGDARALPYVDTSADAVLMLGPLYHLTRRSARLEALSQARCVLCPDGLLVAAAISRYASLCDGTAWREGSSLMTTSVVSSDATLPTDNTATRAGVHTGSRPPTFTVPASLPANSPTRGWCRS
jgi:ubiquinone/menaquinone biosynthesis C-methylase UbiE